MVPNLPSNAASDHCPAPSQWVGFLAGSHTSARIEQLYEHLEHCARCSLVLDQLAEAESADRYEVDGAAVTAESAFVRMRQRVAALGAQGDIDPLQERQQFGRFRLMSRVGSGGFGFVYKAEDPSLQRAVALKVPRNSCLSSPAERQRFIWEGQAAASLRHPNVVSVLEAGECDGVPYIASEFCSGPRLVDVLEHSVVPARTAAEIIRRLALAVKHAHSQGILHRDIKPGNILLDVGGEADLQLQNKWYVPKLADFGLARRIARPGGEEAGSLGENECLHGTISYMAPEYLLGNSDTRSDIYALGVVLYEMVWGERLFGNVDIAERLRRNRAGVEVRRPAARDRYVSSEIAAVCLKCLRNDPEARYQSAGELSDDLQRYLNHEPVHARPASVTRQLKSWIQRDRLRACLAAVLLSVPLLLIVSLAVFNRHLESALKRVEDSERKSRELLYAADMRQMFLAWEGADIRQFQQLHRKYDGAEASDDPRSLEWDLIEKLVAAKSGELRWQAHVGAICCLRFSPDGETLATCGCDGVIRIWEASTGRRLQELRGHDGDVNKIAYLSNGSALLSVGDDSTLRIWDPHTGALQKTVDTATGRIFELGVDHARNLAVTAGDGPQICFWDLDTGEQRSTLPGSIVRALALHPKAPLLAVATSAEGRPLHELLDLTDVKLASQLQSDGGGVVGDMMFSHDGGRLAAASRIGFVRMYKVATGEPLLQLEGHRDAVRTARFAPDDNLIATGSIDQTIRIWDMHGRQQKVLRGHEGEVWTLDFSPAGDVLASGDSHGVVRLWNWLERSDLGCDTVLATLGRTAQSMSQSFSDGRILCSSNSAAFQIVNLDGTTATSIGSPGDAVGLTALAANDSATRVVAGKRDGSAELWDPLSGLRRRWAAHDGPVWCCEFLDERRVLTAGEDGHCCLWDVRSGRKLASTRGHGKPILAAALSPDRCLWVTGGVQGQAILWRIPELQPLCMLPARSDVIHGAAFSPQGDLVATSGHDRAVEVYEVATGRRLARYQGHKSRVLSLAFARDGRTVLSGDAHGDLHLWRVKYAETLGVLDLGRQAIMDILVSSDPNYIAVFAGAPAAGEARLLRWNLPDAVLRE